MVDDQPFHLFDRPVRDYVLERTSLRTLFATTTEQALSYDPLTRSMVLADQRQVGETIEQSLQQFDPNLDAERQRQQESELESKIDRLAEAIVERLSPSQQKELTRIWGEDLGDALLFHIDLEGLRLSDSQADRWRTLLETIGVEAERRTNATLSKIQIRNPQAYVAYRYATRLESLRTVKREYGRRFLKEVIETNQQERLASAVPKRGKSALQK